MTRPRLVVDNTRPPIIHGEVARLLDEYAAIMASGQDARERLRACSKPDIALVSSSLEEEAGARSAVTDTSALTGNPHSQGAAYDDE